MIRYVAILEKEPGTLWGIWFPDLPGCTTAAESAETAMDQAAEALRLWVEDALRQGEGLPRARTIEELRDDEWVVEAIGNGHAAIVVSLRADEAAFDDDALKAIDAEAQKRGVSRIDFVRAAVLEKFAS